MRRTIPPILSNVTYHVFLDVMLPPITTRLMRADDALTVAHLHAASWRVAYRDILSPAYLTTAIDADRHAVWTSRLHAIDTNAFGILAEVHHRAAGFAYVMRPADNVFGNLLDNIHVSPDIVRQGIGRLLFAAIAEELARRGWPAALHLWVYDANMPARQFYDAMAGVCVERRLQDAPDGQQIPAGRYYWDHIGVSL